MARPRFTAEDKEIMVRKLEPYLKIGLPLSRACSEALVSRSTVYYFMNQDEWFLNKIRRFQQFISVLVNNAIVNELVTIVAKQNAGIELNKRNIRFLKWMALNCNLMAEEFGRRQTFSYYDPEWEIQKLNRLIDSDQKNAKLLYT